MLLGVSFKYTSTESFFLLFGEWGEGERYSDQTQSLVVSMLEVQPSSSTCCSEEIVARADTTRLRRVPSNHSDYLCARGKEAPFKSHQMIRPLHSSAHRSGPFRRRVDWVGG